MSPLRQRNLAKRVHSGGFGAFGSLTIQSFGFDSLQSTLIYIPQGFINMVCIFGGGLLATKLPNARIYVSIAMLVPTFIGLLLQIVLPRHNIAGLLTGGESGAKMGIDTVSRSLSLSTICHKPFHLLGPSRS